jgi:hypothetical protein
LSLKIDYKKISDIEHDQEVENSEVFPDISRLVVPFSVAFGNNDPPDIYNGEELIPFKKKDLIFKEILIKEFLNY